MNYPQYYTQVIQIYLIQMKQYGLISQKIAIYLLNKQHNLKQSVREELSNLFLLFFISPIYNFDIPKSNIIFLQIHHSGSIKIIVQYQRKPPISQSKKIVRNYIRIRQQNYKHQKYYMEIQMQQTSCSSIQSVSPLLKLVRDREELYFQLLTFVNKNITSSSNDIDNLTIFNKFMTQANLKHYSIAYQQQQFITNLSQNCTQPIPPDDPQIKQILRLSSRIVEILQASIGRVRKTVFQQNGRSNKQFTRFKTALNKILKRGNFLVSDFSEYIIGYCCNKYKQQMQKMEKYVYRVEEGDDICFRELFGKENSDVESSPDEKKMKQDQKTVKRIERRIDNEHISSAEQTDRKLPFRRNLKTSLKKKDRNLNIKNKEELPNKDQTANKLLKFYALLELNKKQFMEDYVYDKIQEGKHREQLLNHLMERNKTINLQINSFLKRTSTCNILPILAPGKSSGEERFESVASKTSLRASFVISKRKSSNHFESGSDKISDQERHQPFERTIKNINPRRSSQSSQRTQQKSKKLFMVKTPMIFEDQVIPQAQMTQAQWLQAPLTTKCRQKKNDNLRLKKRNNPNPMENTFYLPETFRYPL